MGGSKTGRVEANQVELFYEKRGGGTAPPFDCRARPEMLKTLDKSPDCLLTLSESSPTTGGASLAALGRPAQLPPLSTSRQTMPRRSLRL